MDNDCPPLSNRRFVMLINCEVTPVGIGMFLVVKGCPIDRVSFWTRLAFGRSLGNPAAMHRVLENEILPYFKDHEWAEMPQDKPLTIEFMLKLRRLVVSALASYDAQRTYAAKTEKGDLSAIGDAGPYSPFHTPL